MLKDVFKADCCLVFDFPEARTKVTRLFFHRTSFRVNRNVLACQYQLFDVAEEHHVGDYVMAHVSRLYRVEVERTA